MLVFENFTFFIKFLPTEPLISNFTTMAIVKLCCHNFSQSAYIMILFVSSISYRPPDLSLLKEFPKNVSFSNTGGPRLVRFSGPGKNRTMQNSY